MIRPIIQGEYSMVDPLFDELFNSGNKRDVIKYLVIIIFSSCGYQSYMEYL